MEVSRNLRERTVPATFVLGCDGHELRGAARRPGHRGQARAMGFANPAYRSLTRTPASCERNEVPAPLRVRTPQRNTLLTCSARATTQLTAPWSAKRRPSFYNRLIDLAQQCASTTSCSLESCAAG